MPEKTTKKTTAKKTVAKKVAAKPAVKKAPVKKVAVQKVAPVAVAEPVVESHTCGCGCGHDCKCGGACKCKKCGFFKKFILLVIVFALGFAAAQMYTCKRGNMMPKPEFENGCLVVKCPKLAEMAPKIDTNADGCISMEEFKQFKKSERPAGRKPRGPRHGKTVEPVPAPQMN
ncbi:MAG: hypothetical protein E7006_03775 [Alphaproteobacteria bacterium]|nr:hypothetical protein [Alphaproteobacteria bacterium]